MPEDPPETPNYGFPIMSEADDDYVDIWQLILEDGGPTDNDGLIEPLDAILDDIQSDVDGNASDISSNETDISTNADDISTNSTAISSLEDDVDDHETRISDLEEDDGGVDSGIITMWSGGISDIPSGWVLCDGNNGTPDLTDRFVVGAGSNYNVGDTGGSETVQLSRSEMPSHSHEYNHPASTGADYSDFEDGDSSQRLQQKDTSTEGGDGSHENRPPYYSLAYIMAT